MEKDRNMSTYHCRLTKATKAALLQQAAVECRTANKLLEDAFYIYLAEASEDRKDMVKIGKEMCKKQFQQDVD